MWYVYILRCKNDTYYTGFTKDLKDRMRRHNKGEVHTCYGSDLSKKIGSIVRAPKQEENSLVI